VTLVLLGCCAVVASAFTNALGIGGIRSPHPRPNERNAETGDSLANSSAAVGSSARLRRMSAKLASTFPFQRSPANRPPSRAEVVSMYADELRCSVGCRPYAAGQGWPLKPFHSEHALRAGLNELRPASLHVGVDIQARDGARVYAVQRGYARILQRSGPDARVQVGNYIYWHINPAVKQGQLVSAFATELGTVMAGYGHIAFSELGSAGQYVNPLRALGRVLTPWVDRIRPVIGSLSLARDGQAVVPAFDPQTFTWQTTYITPVLAPAALAYRLFDMRGTPVTSLRWAFRGTHLLPYADRRLIYSPGAHAPGYGCFAKYPLCIPYWSYRLAGGFAPALPVSLPRARYRLTVYAWDWADNEDARDSVVSLGSSGWRPIGRVPVQLLSAPAWQPGVLLGSHLSARPSRLRPRVPSSRRSGV
jgi:hypothetical protein